MNTERHEPASLAETGGTHPECGAAGWSLLLLMDSARHAEEASVTATLEPTAPPAAAPQEGRRAGRRLTALLPWLLLAAALGFIGVQAPTLGRGAVAAAGEFGRLNWGFLAASLALGLGTIAVYAELHRRLLRVGGADVPHRTVQSITFAQNAITNTVPVVGGAGALAYAITRLRRRGVDSALAAWAVLFASVLDILVLVALAAVALAATGRVPVVVAAVVIVLLAGFSCGVWLLVTHPPVLRAAVQPLLLLDGALPRRCVDCRAQRAANLEASTRRVALRLALLRPTGRQWATLLALTSLTWLLDFADLTFAAAASTRPIPWSALVAGFLVVQASIALAILPGGTGLAEVGLLGTLLASGVAAGPAAATVLIYRLASWLTPSLVGWGSYAATVRPARPVPHVHEENAATSAMPALPVPAHEGRGAA